MSSGDIISSVTDGFERPKKRFVSNPTRPQPARKSTPPVKILPNVTGLRTDEQLEDFLERNKRDTVVVNFGSSWCAHCHKMLPHFIALTKAFPQMKYAVAQVEYMHAGAAGITHTPTFAVYRRGRRVDQFYGAQQQQLRDHIWLWSDADSDAEVDEAVSAGW